MKNYKEIDFYAGETIHEAVDDLLKYKNKGILASGIFNGQILYSDVDDYDSAYIKITGKTKEQHDRELKQMREESLKIEEEHKKSIPQLERKYNELAENLIREDKLDYWREIVPIRLNDLYKGFELDCTLKIAEILKQGNNSDTFEQVKKELNTQGHSGMSYGLIKLMIKEFCYNGEDFIKWLG